MDGGLLEMYYTFLKDEYNSGKPKQFFAASCIGMQLNRKTDYWCISKEVRLSYLTIFNASTVEHG